MKKYYLVILGLFLTAIISFTAYGRMREHKQVYIKSSSYISIDEPSRSGCCSWHGGVCGCSMGSAVCCDGTTSPSCGCN